jgi:hypothetical protein
MALNCDDNYIDPLKYLLNVSEIAKTWQSHLFEFIPTTERAKVITILSVYTQDNFDLYEDCVLQQRGNLIQA